MEFDKKCTHCVQVKQIWACSSKAEEKELSAPQTPFAILWITKLLMNAVWLWLSAAGALQISIIICLKTLWRLHALQVFDTVVIPQTSMVMTHPWIRMYVQCYLGVSHAIKKKSIHTSLFHVFIVWTSHKQNPLKSTLWTQIPWAQTPPTN